MKTTLILFVLLGFLFATEGFSQWSQQNSNTTVYLTTIDFPASDTGYIGGQPGILNSTLLKTIDGGLNWLPLSLPSNKSIASIWFNDPNNGYALTASDQLCWKTTSGGAIWDSIPTGAYSFNNSQLYFSNSQYGYILGPNTGGNVIRTTDSGMSWASYPPFTFTGALSSVHFPDSISSIGYAASAFDGDIYKTTDNGQSWFVVSQPSGQNFMDIFFTSIDTGYVLGANFVIKTVDAGVNWMVINGSVGGQKFVFTNDTTCYVMSQYNISKSIDGCQSFTSMTGINIGAYLLDIEFASRNVGYCVGINGEIYKTDLNLGIESNSHTTDLLIFPNPIQNHLLNVEVPGFGYLKVSDPLGKVTYEGFVSQNTNVIDLIHAPSGVYLVSFRNESLFITKKIIVN